MLGQSSGAAVSSASGSAIARSAIATQRTLPAKGRTYGIGLKLGIAGLLLLLAALGVIWLLQGRSSPPRYVTQTVTHGAVTRKISATGTVNPVLTILVGSYVSGVIQQLFCDYNTQVKAGQICAKIDPRPFQATFDQYSGQLMRDQAILDRDRANLARYQKLVKQDSIARQQAEDQAHLVEQDEGTVKLDQALVDGAKLNLGYTDIVSPVDGTVVSRNVTQGQTVAASFQTPTLFLIATDLTKMQVDTNTSESDIGNVEVGDKATFTVDAYPQRVFAGTVAQVRQSPQTVQNVVTYDAVVTVDNKDLALMPGMTASTQIVVAERADVLRVPDQALRYAPEGTSAAQAGGSQVWVLQEGKPVAVAVKLGLDDGTFTEIVGGALSAGDQVVVTEERQGAARPSVPQPRL